MLSDAIEDARRIRERIDALADAATELLRDVRREADRLTAELGFEPELLHGVVELDAGEGDSEPDSDTGRPTAVHAEPELEAPAAVDAVTLDDPSLDLSEPEGTPEEPAGDSEESAATASAESAATASEEPAATAEDESADGFADEPGTSRDETVSRQVAGADGTERGAGARATDTHTELADAVVEAEPDEKATGKSDAGPAERAGKQADDGGDGDERTMSEPCPACDRTGRCQRCDGSGRRLLFRCSACKGSGRCNVCGGPGFIWSGSPRRSASDSGG